MKSNELELALLDEFPPLPFSDEFITITRTRENERDMELVEIMPFPETDFGEF